jgi:hypothetical protein
MSLANSLRAAIRDDNGGHSTDLITNSGTNRNSQQITWRSILKTNVRQTLGSSD